MDDNSCSYRFNYAGPSTFVRKVAIPFAESLEFQFADDDSVHEAQSVPAYLETGPTKRRMDAGTTVILTLGVSLFLVKWFAERVLDDVYDAKFQPMIKKALGTADKGVHPNSASRPKMFMLGISYSQANVFILIALVADSFQEILESERMIHTAHENAIKWIENNGVGEPIHFYSIEYGKLNLEPVQFKNLKTAHAAIHKMKFKRLKT